MAKKQAKAKKILLFLCGIVILVFGIVLILKWWTYVGVLFKGVIGMIVALTGLVLLGMAKD